MHIKLCLTICQTSSRQPLGRGDRFQSGMRHQSLSHGDWFICVCGDGPPSQRGEGWLIAPSPSQHSLWLPDTMLYTQCWAWKCLFTLRWAKPPHAQYHLGVFRPNWSVCCCERSRFSSLVIACLAAFVHLFQDRLDGGVLFVCFVGLPVFWPRCYDSWLTSG